MVEVEAAVAERELLLSTSSTSARKNPVEGSSLLMGGTGTGMSMTTSTGGTGAVSSAGAGAGAGNSAGEGAGEGGVVFSSFCSKKREFSLPERQLW